MNEWISVEDKLPTKRGKYLVFRKAIHRAYIDLVYYDPKYIGNDEKMKDCAIWFLYDSEWGDYEINGVTHWIPLPEPPKMKGENK